MAPSPLQLNIQREKIECQFRFGNEQCHHFRPDTITWKLIT